MNITMDDTRDTVTGNEMLAKLALLDEDASGTLQQMSLIIIDTLINKKGTIILMADVMGNGVAQIVAAGNPSLVPPLLYTASEAADAMFKKPEASTVQ